MTNVNTEVKTFSENLQGLSDFLDKNYITPGSLFYLNGAIYAPTYPAGVTPEIKACYMVTGYVFIVSPFRLNKDNRPYKSRGRSYTYSTLEELVTNSAAHQGNYYIQVFMKYFDSGNEVTKLMWPIVFEAKGFYQAKLDTQVIHCSHGRGRIVPIKKENDLYECRW